MPFAFSEAPETERTQSNREEDRKIERSDLLGDWPTTTGASVFLKLKLTAMWCRAHSLYVEVKPENWICRVDRKKSDS